MRKIKNFFIVLILFLTVVGFLVPADAQAFSLMGGVNGSCWSEGGESPGNCSICDVLRVVFNVGKFIFASMAAIALLMFLWGAIGLIFNGGNMETVAQSKKIILHTLLAVVIIMIAWLAVNTLISILADVEPGGIFSQTFWKTGQWWVGPSCR